MWSLLSSTPSIKDVTVSESRGENTKIAGALKSACIEWVEQENAPLGAVRQKSVGLGAAVLTLPIFKPCVSFKAAARPREGKPRCGAGKVHAAGRLTRAGRGVKPQPILRPPEERKGTPRTSPHSQGTIFCTNAPLPAISFLPAFPPCFSARPPPRPGAGALSPAAQTAAAAPGCRPPSTGAPLHPAASGGRSPPAA